MPASLIFIPSFLLTFTACIYHPFYPKDWDRVTTNDGGTISDLTGLYQCWGDARTGFLSKTKTNIAYELFGLRNQGSCDTIEINHYNGNIELTAHSKETHLHQNRTIKGMNIQNGRKWIVLHTTETFSGDNVAVIGASKSFIGKTVSGDLVIKSESWSLGIALFIPMFASGHTWMKFDAINKQ